MIKHQLPKLYWTLIPKNILEFGITETKATCDDCAMQPGRTRTKITYDPVLKCCTYEPWLPNYHVGGILSESEREIGRGNNSSNGKGNQGAHELRRKIERRQYSLPLGMVPALRFQIEFNARKKHEFGNRADWLCPYYDKVKNLCSIWQYRGSVCTSFYCKSVKGNPGLNYWEKLKSYLGYVEMALMEECLVQLDFSPRQMSDLLGYLNRTSGTSREKSSWVLPEVKARMLWNGYYDEQEHFFKKCFQYVNSLDKKAFNLAMGETGSGLEDELSRMQKSL